MEEGEAEDVQRMTELINKEKCKYQAHSFDLEFQEFVNFRSNEEYEDFKLIDEDEDIDDVKVFCPDPQAEVSVTALTEEESAVIESCKDEDLKKLLLLNRKRNMQLMQLQKRIQHMLMDCERELADKKQEMKISEEREKGQVISSPVWKLSAPYFKDSKFFPCGLNKDTIRKRQNHELCIYDLSLPRKWTALEFDKLVSSVKCNYNINRQNEIVRKLNSLRTMEDIAMEPPEVANEIISLKEELRRVKDEDEVPPLNSDKLIDWYKVAEVFMRDKRTASECKSVWHMLVHPDIDKSYWTKDENTRLETIAKSFSFQNWDAIAEKMNSSSNKRRTGFTACLHYYSKLCDKFRRNKFSPVEDRAILDAVDYYKVGAFIPWDKVVHHFELRSRHQIYHRYMYFLSQNHVRKGKFTEAEDVLLMLLVKKFGRNFRKCSEYMPHRSQIQLKSRYSTNLQTVIKKGNFTEEEDRIIYDHVERNGMNGWPALARQMHRCGSQIRQRHKFMVKFFEANTEATIADIPRRKHFLLEDDSQYNFMQYMVEHFENHDPVPTIAMIEESLNLEAKKRCVVDPQKAQNKDKNVEMKTLDDLLADCFDSGMKLRENRAVSSTNLEEATSNVQEVLSLLKANIEIPEHLEVDSNLDDIDVEILGRLASRNVPRVKSGKMDQVLPPTINTLVGLRSLLINHRKYKNEKANKEINLKTNEDRALFSQRFDALFQYSAVLSLEKPSVNKAEEASNDDTPPAKRQKINVTAISSLFEKPKLVNKKVVDQLMERKNVNIIKLDNVRGSDGVVRAVLKNSAQVAPGLSTETPLKSEVVQCSEDDYNDMQSDVQLLNEILSTEMMLKSEPDCS